MRTNLFLVDIYLLSVEHRSNYDLIWNRRRAGRIHPVCKILRSRLFCIFQCVG